MHFFFRKRLPEYHSIEEVFDKVIRNLNGYVKHESFTVPYPSNSIVHIVKNLIYAFRNRGDINHITGDVYYLGWVLPPKKTVITVHDISSTLKRKGLKNILIKHFWYTIPLRRAHFITAISHQSKKEIIKIIGINPDKILVIYNPLPDISKIAVQQNTSKSDKILIIGTKSNKNLERVIEAVNGMSVELNILGLLTSNQVGLLKNNRIDYRNYTNLSYDKVLALYIESSFLCFPSLYEGFGVPIIEAQALGIPVVTSNYGAMQEIANNAACLVDPHSVPSIREGILKVLNDSEYRDELVRKGKENIKRFEPGKIAEMYMDVYREVEGKSSSRQ